MWKIIALFIIIELFEAYWQRASTLVGSLAKGYYFYSKSIFLFLFAHLGYLYTLYISLAFDLLNWPIFFILLFKSMDMFMKIHLYQRVFENKEADENLRHMLESEIPFWYYFVGAVTYPWLLYLAFGV